VGVGALLLQLLPLEVRLPWKRRWKRRRKKRFVLWHGMCFYGLLVLFFQEESDDDMGFGLFD
jgi:hypothetical protein